jgi:hypothetical protein
LLLFYTKELGLAQIKVGRTSDGIQQLVLHGLQISVGWQLEQVHARSRGGQALCSIAVQA